MHNCVICLHVYMHKDTNIFASGTGKTITTSSSAWVARMGLAFLKWLSFCQREEISMMRSYCNIGEGVVLQYAQIKVQCEQKGSFGLKKMFENVQGEIASYAIGT